MVGRFSFGNISMGMVKIAITENSSTPKVITITAMGFFKPEDTNDIPDYFKVDNS
jgi:hypothetical protein